ncbi:hypothetical protein [Jannaschia donghaensis]|uniref:Uncharacterized protein n=1 Tax=Jannaschia donghaensis TaxID=420998 RepID=A0A0M6YML4_9RHOB|nr:hypothetical protein [Jannaschia donghaensis]CTQ50895.1 hypothetical protein JDO7802_02926 [Jannaschia donghaensis]
MRRLILCSALAMPLPVSAQEASLLDAFHPDRILTQILQSLVGAARTQGRVTYGDLSLSLAQGRLSVADLEVSVPSRDAPCIVGVRSLDLMSDDPLSLVNLSGRVDLRGVTMTDACLTELDAAPLAMILPGDGVSVPEVTIDYAYDAPSSALDLRIGAQVTGVAALTVAAEFPYFWVREGPDDAPVIDADLARVTVALDNLGGFEMARAVLPPPLTDPDTAAAYVVQALTPVLEGAAGDQPMPKSAKAFVAVLGEGWSAFVADPDRLVIESGFDAAVPRHIDGAFVRRLEDGPLPLIELLEPQVGNASAAERDVLDPALVARAMADPGSLTTAEARAVGLAHLRGDRAPRHSAQAQRLLAPLVEAGDTEVALELAQALMTSDSVEAYRMALAAGPGGAPRLRAMLDRLEDDMPFATRLRLQAAAPEPSEAAFTGPTAELRARAEAHLRGVGAVRSLPLALLFASVAAAEGDADARALLDRIARAVPMEARADWAATRNDVADRATTIWLARRGG